MNNKKSLKKYLHRVYEAYLYDDVVISGDTCVFFHDSEFHDMELSERIELLDLLDGVICRSILMISLNIRFPREIPIAHILWMLEKNVPRDKKIIFISSCDFTMNFRRDWFGRTTLVQRTDHVHGIEEQKHGLFINPSFKVSKDPEVLKNLLKKINIINSHYAFA